MAQEKNYPEIHQHFLSLMGQYQKENPSVMYGLEAFEALGQFAGAPRDGEDVVHPGMGTAAQAQ
jgi:hypothetical protein